MKEYNRPAKVTNIYSGHMRKTGAKRKTRYTDAEIERLKNDAYEKGRTEAGTTSHTEDGSSYDQGRRDQLTQLEEWITNAEGRPGKRQVLDKIALLKEELGNHG